MVEISDKRWRELLAVDESDDATGARVGLSGKTVGHHRRRLGIPVRWQSQPGNRGLAGRAKTMLELDMELRGRGKAR